MNRLGIDLLIKSFSRDMTVHLRYLPAAVLLAFGQPAFAQEAAPGLALTLTHGDNSDAIVAPNVWLQSREGETPSPFLVPGRFTATWQGFVSVDLRSIYSFQAEVKGTFTLAINDKPVLEVTGDGAMSEPSARLRLNKGENPLLATFTPPDSGDGFVRLFWVPRNTYAQPIPQNALSHHPDEAIARSQQRHRGRELMLEHRCFNCHTTDQGALPELTMDAPAFDGIGSRRHEAWMAEWIANPRQLRDSARMPAVFHGAESLPNAAAIAAYLGTLTSTESAPAEAAGASTVEAGSVLFTDLHCIACHNEPGATDPGADKLSFDLVGQKFKPGALSEFLENPGRHYAWIRMPNFRLSAEEADQLAAYLLSPVKGPPKQSPGDAAQVLKGKELVQTSGCLNCHTGPLPNEFETTPLNAIANWETGCLAESPVGMAPGFSLSDDDRAAIRSFAAGGFESLQRHVDWEFAGRQVNNLNCIGCHGRQIDLVPPLELLGGKIKPEHGAAIIAGKVTEKPRPWIKARMPGFDKPAAGIARGLANQHAYPAVTPADGPIDQSMADVGLKLVSPDGGFSCISCHAVGKAGATQVFESAGINFASSHERLQHEYFVQWMLNPLLVDPASKMPVFFDEEGRSPLFEIYDGDGRKQIEALWQYVRNGAAMKIPEGMSTNTAAPVHLEGFE